MRRIAAAGTVVVCLLASGPARAGGTDPNRGHVVVTIAGNGTVTDDRGQLTCRNHCETDYDAGQVTYTATPDAGWRFAGWSGACAQFTGPTCSANGAFDATFGATFTEVPADGGGGSGGGATEPPAPQLVPVRIGRITQGYGTVSSRPGGILCERTVRQTTTGTCVSTFAAGTEITLQFRPGLGWSVFEWAGSCEARGNRCTFVVGPDGGSVDANILETHVREGQFRVGTANNGRVHIGSNLFCPPVCTFALGGARTLSPQNTAQVVFDHWAGWCQPLIGPHGDCVVSGGRADGPFWSTAVFRPRGTFTFDITGNGRMAIRSPGGPAQYCPPTCSVRIPDGGLIAEPDADPGYVFDRYYNGIFGTAYCWNTYVASLVRRRDCPIHEHAGDHRTLARFRRIVGEGRISVQVIGPGSVSRYAGDRRIGTPCRDGCVDDLGELHERARNAVYAPQADPGARFTGWQGCRAEREVIGEERIRVCSLEDVFERTPADRTITAFFEREPTVTFRRYGAGRITFDGDREACPPACDPQVPLGGALTARATAERGYYFDHWEESCRGQDSSCRLLNVNGNQTVRAVFLRRGNVEVRIRGNGTVRSVRGPNAERADDFFCTRETSPCDAPLFAPGLWRAIRASPVRGWRFSHYEGYCASVFRPAECHVEGGAGRYETTAVFERE